MAAVGKVAQRANIASAPSSLPQPVPQAQGPTYVPPAPTEMQGTPHPPPQVAAGPGSVAGGRPATVFKDIDYSAFAKPAAPKAAPAPPPAPAPAAAPPPMPPSVQAIAKVPMQDPPNGATGGGAAPMMMGGGDAVSSLLGDQDGALRQLGRRMPAQDSMALASIGKRIY